MFRALISILLGLLITLGSVCVYADGVNELLQRIRIQETAQILIMEQLQIAGAAKPVDQSLVQQLNDYLEQIEAQLAKDRALLASMAGSGGMPADITAVTERRASVPVIIVDELPENNSELKSLDARLNSSIGDFDERLLTEAELAAEQAAAVRRSSAASGAGAAGQAGGAQGGQSGGGGEGEQSAMGGSAGGGSGEAGEQQAQQGRAGTMSGSAGASGTAEDAETGNRTASTYTAPGGSEQRSSRTRRPPPPNLPSRDDDDIVARQLREAAERETDPVLKAKLWDEYLKYKQAGG